MATEQPEDLERGGGFFSRLWRRVSTPSATWSVLALVVVGLIIGAGGVIGTQVMVAATGSTEFCGGACHSMQRVTQEYRQSVHYANRTGMRASCHDCHIPDTYPKLLWYKAKAGIHDAIEEVRGTISSEDKFKKERLRLAQSVWAEFKENNSENCQHCHTFSADTLAKQQEFVRPMHQQFLARTATCIDCHKGIAHTAPDE